MATVHPSRMGLVPQDSPKSRDALPSPSRRRGHEQDKYERRDYSRERRHERSRSRDRSDRADKDVRDRDRDRYGRRERSVERDYDRRRSRREDSPERRREDRKDRDRDGDRRREDARGDDGYRRRASPAYDDYRRPSPPPPRDTEAGKDGSGGSQPWRRPENVYPSRGGGRGGYGGIQAGSDFMESRRLQRESTTRSIWPSSPKAPSRELSPPGDHKRSKRSRRSASVSSDSDDDSEEERRRRRERKEKKRARKEKEKKDRKDKKKRKKYSDDEEDEDDRSRDDRQPRDKSKRRSRSRTVDDRSLGRSRSPTRPPVTDDEEANDDETEWVEKPSAATTTMPPPPAPVPNDSKAGTSVVDEEDYSDDEVGPQPITRVDTRNNKRNESRYGGALLRGEGSAMAAFLQDDTQTRIPRRGEIGLTSDEIANYESVGYVMSGSRHRRMNAVRMRKENQVISAEEKRGILKLQKEERERREAILREEFAELIKENLKKTGKP